MEKVSTVNLNADKNSKERISENNLLKYKKLNRINKNLFNSSELYHQEQQIIKIYKVKYKSPQELNILLKELKKNILDKKGSITYDQSSSILIVIDYKDNVDKVLSIINKLDVPSQQLLIETNVVKTSCNIYKELGLNYNFKSLGLISKLNFDSSLNNLSSTATINFAKLSKGLILDLELQALEKEQKLSILACPKLRTLDKKSAIIESGKEIPYITRARAGSDPNVIFKKATLRLEVIPIIKPNNQVLLDIRLNKDQPGVQVPGISQAPIDTTQVITKVLAENKQTIMIGGIFTTKLVTSHNKVPILGDLPLINVLFRSKQNNIEKSEIIIFVKPTIIS